MPAFPVRLPTVLPPSVFLLTVLLLTVCLQPLLGSSPVSARQTEDQGQDDQDEYVELFDPDSEHPQEPAESQLPELELDGIEEGNDGETAPLGSSALRPWDQEPKQVPSRVLDAGDLRDPRSVELFFYGCANELQRRDVTLFANGTLRLRRGPLDRQEMQLDEIGPIELRGHLDRLLRLRASRDFPTEIQLRGSVEGRWTNTCRFSLDLPGFEAVALEVGSFDALPMVLRQLQLFADELAGLTRPLVKPDALGSGYDPVVGDVLRDREGEMFRVLGKTSDGRAVELERLDGERRIFVALEEISEYFVSLEPDLSG